MPKSGYEMKKLLLLFSKAFEINKNGVLLFEISWMWFKLDLCNNILVSNAVEEVKQVRFLYCLIFST